MIGAVRKATLFIPNLIPVSIALAVALANVVLIGMRMTLNAAWDGEITNEERTAIEIETWKPVWSVLRKLPFIRVL